MVVPTTNATEPEQRWNETRVALREEVDRVVSLLRSLGEPAAAKALGPAKVVGEWDLIQVAVHLSHAWSVVPNLARGNVAAGNVTPCIIHASCSSGERCAQSAK